MTSRSREKFSRCVLAAAVMALGTAWGPAQAELTDLANSPLANSPTTAVLPNLMFVLDNSGSMGWEWMPDNATNSNVAKSRCSQSNCSNTSTAGRFTFNSTGPNYVVFGDPPLYAAEFNSQFYNPQITYRPGVNADGTPMASQGSPWTAVRTDPYRTSSTIDLTTQFPEIVYCKNDFDSPTDATNCRRNGIDTPTPSFVYNTVGEGFPNGTNSGNFRFPKVRSGAPHYYTITPREYCSDSNLVFCQLATAPSGAFVFPASVRYCKTTGNAQSTSAVSGPNANNPDCRKKFASGTYNKPRYGNFTRTDIVPATTTYGNRPNRTDCAAAPTCTYTEEMTNFANWYAYFRTRMQTMKSAAGRAFSTIGDGFRVGFLTISPGNPVRSSDYLDIDKFDASQKSDWYSKFYAIDPSGSTPLREALSRIGRHYAGRTDGINSGMPEDPVQFSCQQNFTLLTTDGFWNSSAGQQIDGSAMGNQDNTDSGFSTRAVGAYDGNLTGSTDTLADVSMYYYKTDLRSAMTDNVPTTPRDAAAHQHMTTFTLGLGLDGLMDFRSDYETATTGDFASIKSASTGCSWASGTCNWPVPAADSPSALDDLWHAAVNGRGIYFSAKDPNSLSTGIAGSLSALTIQLGAAAASATSSPNITQSDNFIYSSTFRTVKWDGEVVAQKIDPATGNVVPAIVWSTTAGGPSPAAAPLNSRVSANSDTRTIHTFDSGTATKLKPFQWASLTAAEQAYFNNQVCGTQSQCSSLSAGLQAQANDGQNLVEYLRGQTGHERQGGNLEPVYRDRELVLGDPVNGTPNFVRAPIFGFTSPATPDYAAFKAANSSRQPVLYVAANDGMLHAFNGDTGSELWAYVPRILFPKLHKLAEANYANVHEFFVDGSPQVMDAVIGGAWKTILVGGLNGGGRGYYALDITDPNTPKGLWEICSDSALCGVSDADLGLTYGNPVITQRATDGRWVVLVTSGYNNVSPGTGRGYLFVLDAETGAVLRKVDTGVGDTTTPSGLAKISGFADNFNLNNTAKWVYGGDLLGNLWRFDMQTDPPAVLKVAELRDGGGKPQSVTTRPELGLMQGFPVVFVGTGRYLGVNDLVDPATLGLPYAFQQSVYAIKDTGTAYGDFRSGGVGGAVVQQTITQSDPTTRTISNNPVDWTTGKGWFVDLNPGNQSPGERVNIDAQLVLGTLLVVTNVPNSSPCSVGGDSWLYQFNSFTGGYVASSPDLAVATKLSSTLTVGNVVVRLPSGQLKTIATGATGAKTTFGVNTGGGGGGGRRISWRELIK